MGLDVSKTVVDSFATLFNNKSAALFAIIGSGISLILSSILLLGITAVSSFMLYGSGSGLSPLSFNANMLILSIAILIIGYFVSVFMYGAIISAVYAGAKGSITNAARTAYHRLLYLAATFILFSIIVIIGMVCFIIPGIYLYTRLSLSMPETVVGGKGPIDALKGSWSKTRGNAFPVFLVLLIIFIATSAIALISMIPTLLTAFIGGLLLLVVSAILQLIVGFFNYAMMIGQVLIYGKFKQADVTAKASTGKAAKK